MLLKGRKALISGAILGCLIISAMTAFAAPPIPGTYNPETMTFYETGEKVPMFYDQPGPMRPRGAYRGVWNFPVLFIETQDVSHTYPVSAWEDQLFTIGTHATGSMRDYYREISYGNFDIDGVALGWITADHDYEYYHQNNYGFDGGAAAMAKEAVEKAEAMFNPDWSQFDNDNDGEVDGVVIIHMGPGGEGGNPDQIWSHVSNFDPVTIDGVKISSYSIQPETRGNGSLETIGTICHEHGHVLGLPDLYDINYTAGKFPPVGKYCLMASGSSGGNPMGSNPAHMCAWSRYDLGWIDAPVIDSSGTFSIDDVQTHQTNSAYRVNIPESEEYFLITNRWMDADIQFKGMPDRFKGGMLIFHVDDTYTFSNDGRNDFWHVVIEDAVPDAQYDLADGGFGAGINDSFGRFSDPNTDGNYHPSGINVYNISAQAETMNFSVNFSPVVSVRDYELTSLGNNRYSLKVDLENITDIPANDLTLALSTTAGNVNLETAQINLGNLTPHTRVKTETPFVFQTTNDESSFANFTIQASGPSFQGKNISFLIPVNPARILLVDDDNTKGSAGDFEQYWIEGLGPIGVSHQVWDTWEDGLPQNGLVNAYDLVIWCDGQATRSVPKEGEGLEIIEDYLDRGGDLIWSSQEFLYSQYGAGPDDSDHIITEPGDFAREYLHITELEHDEYIYHATGVPGTASEGLTLALNDVISEDPTGMTSGGYDWWPDEFLTDGTCIPLLISNGPEWPWSTSSEYYAYYQDDLTDNSLTNAPCAMLYQGQHRLMFMAASLHGITTDPAASPNTRQEFLNRIFNWFGVARQNPGLDIDVNDPMIQAGEPCHVTLKIFNPGDARSVNTFIAMEAYGLWLFGPTWTEEMTYYPMDLNAGDSVKLDVFPEFAWPTGAGSGTVTFWSVMVDSNSGAMVGNYDFTPLSWM